MPSNLVISLVRWYHYCSSFLCWYCKPPCWHRLECNSVQWHCQYLPYYLNWIRIAHVQYIPRNMHTVFALLCFVVVIHWLIFPYPSGLLHWHCGNLTIAPVPAKQPWWIWINTSCEFIMNDCITTTKQSTTKPCAYFLGYTVAQVCFPRCMWTGTTIYIKVVIYFMHATPSHYHYYVDLLTYIEHIRWKNLEACVNACWVYSVESVSKM